MPLPGRNADAVGAAEHPFLFMHVIMSSVFIFFALIDGVKAFEKAIYDNS